jgi:exopolyphosphatase/guanosine-5'-triphosphate,3'-diphosphate pyrophosphatase
MRVAAIDLGSNSFHMLIAEILGPSSFETVLQDKMMIQLGRTALVTGRLDPQAMEKGLRCLDEFRRMALARRVERTVAVATSAIREAENGAEFLRRAREESGLAVRVISGREEARMIHLAVSRHVDLQSEKALMVDIGGGSVELTVGDSSKIYYSTSLKLGFLRLHGRFVTSNPINKKESRVLNGFLRDSLQHTLAAIRRHNPGRVIGTSGSITSLLRLAEQRRGGSSGAPNVVTREEIQKVLADLSAVHSVERARRFDLDPLRSEYLPTALLCLGEILDGAGAGEITVCPVALREGVVYDLAASLPARTAPVVSNDLRFQAVIDLASRCDYPAEHSHHVAHLAGQVFNQTQALHGLGENEARMLHFASILHDIGYHIGYAKHHKHGYYLVMNCDLRGFTPEERSVLANIVRYHRRALPKTSHAPFADLPSRARKTVKTLSAILRIADGLDMSHFSLVDEVKCTMGKKKVHFQLFTNAVHSKVELDLWAAKNHARFFEKLFDVDSAFSAKKKARGPAISDRATERTA